jgi:2-polyprenyl-3-methyl-5-hydroxy-6-metoxy-1,4-benzoquinol methylase
VRDIIDYYSSFDEWGRLEREPLEFRINWHFIKTNLPPKGKVLDNGAGPGKYSMELAKLGYNVTLTDLTPRHQFHHFWKKSPSRHFINLSVVLQN